MSSCFNCVDFCTYKKIPYKSNIRKSFPMSLVDPSYYVPSTSDPQNSRSVSQTYFDVPKDSDGSFDYRLAKIRRPGLDVTETSDLVKDIMSDTKDMVSKDVDTAIKSDQARKENQAKIDSALQSVIDSNTVQNTSKN